MLRFELLERFVRALINKKFPDVAQKEVGAFSLSLADRGKIVGMFVISWLLYSVHFFLVAAAIIPVTLENFLILAGINALAWSIGYISIITPSGTGVRETVTIVALTSLGIMGPVDALVIALLARIIAVISEVGVFGALKLFVLMKGKLNDE
jgi:hypothetical protein